MKTKYYTMGYDSHIDHNDVNSMLTAQEVTTILSWAQDANKDTGETDASYSQYGQGSR